jgi:HlyD family secretion protein
MSSLRYAGVLLGVLVLGTGGTVSAQDPKGVGSPERKGVEVRNSVEGQTSIIFLQPEGEHLKTGELVCELDSTLLQDKLANQKTVVSAAENAYRSTKLEREVSEIGLTEYIEGTYRLESESIRSEIAKAQAMLKQAEDRLERSNRMYSKGLLSKAQNTADKDNLERKKSTMERVKSKLDVLERYTKERMIKKLKIDVEKAKGEESVKQAILDREKSAEERLARQIANCKLLAPVNGRVHYPRPLEAGSTVGLRQLLCLIIPDEGPKAEKVKPSP